MYRALFKALEMLPAVCRQEFVGKKQGDFSPITYDRLSLDDFTDWWFYEFKISYIMRNLNVVHRSDISCHSTCQHT